MEIGNTHLDAAHYLFTEVGLTLQERCIGLGGVAAIHAVLMGATSAFNCVSQRRIQYNFTKVSSVLLGLGVFTLVCGPNFLLAEHPDLTLAEWKQTQAVVEGIALLQLSYWALSSRRSTRAHAE